MIQVVDQTVRRVFGGESVPAPEKVVSLFEPHTAIIRRRKESRDTEFGRGPEGTPWLDEVEGWIISSYRILHGNPPDVDQLGPALATHRRLFGRPRICWLSIGGSIQSAMNASPRKRESNTSPSPSRVITPKSGMPTSGRAGWDAVGTKVRRDSVGGSAGEL